MKKKTKTAAQIKAIAKRDRKAAALARSSFRAVVATGHPGAEFARGEIRRVRAKAIDAGSATAARERMKARRADAPGPRSRVERVAERIRLSPVPEGFSSWGKQRRRTWANQREIDRQRSEMDALVRGGVPVDEARRRFGSL